MGFNYNSLKLECICAMITLQDFCSHLDQLLDVAAFTDYGPNGLQVEGKQELRKIAVSVSASLEAIESAVKENADLLLVHHGLFWDRGSRCILGTMRKKLKLLLSNDISLVAYHLPLDAHREFGNNWRAALDLKWENLEPFGEYNGVQIGVKGTFPKMKREIFAKKLSEYYQHECTMAKGGPDEVSSAALVSGGSYRSINEAAQVGVDCFITGNYDEPAWHTAYEEKINFFSLGHAATEKVGPLALGEHLSTSLQLEWEYLDTINPF